MKTIVIIGAGKGMGNHIGEKFAQNDFRVVLVARRQEALDEYVEEFKNKGYEAYGQVADASDIDSLNNVLDDIISKFDNIDVLVYNVADMEAKNASELSSQEMISHYITDVVGAQVSASKVIPVMKENGGGAILFTGGLFGVYPNAYYEFACMSMDKAALRQFAQMLNAELSEESIFVGIVNIMGVVGSDETHQPSKIADKYWELYKKQSEFEINY